MTRQLNTETLDGAAKHLAAQFLQPDRKSLGGAFIGGPAYVMQNLHAYTFADEFDFILEAFRNRLGQASLDEFEPMALATFTPRKEKVFHKLLADRLAIDPDGEHIPGKIGTVDLGARVVGRGFTRLGNPKNLYWPIYAGEGEERIADSGVAHELPPGAEPLPLSATSPQISNEIALLMANAGIDNVDEGAGAAVIQGRTGAQPTDPDTAVTGTLLFSLVMSDPAFTAATDAAPGALKTASAITDDSSADATGTLGYCRISSTTTPPTPIDDHIDGKAESPSGGDFNWNTLEIVSGGVVSMTALTITIPEA